MKRRELVRKLNALGWRVVRQGGNHEIFGKDGTERTIPVARHVEINENTARGILREAAK